MAPARILIAPVLGTGEFGWRFLASNNRAVGSGTGLFVGHAACSAAVLELQAAATGLSGVQSLDLHSGRWVWRAQQGQTCVAVASREYEAQRDNEASMNAFLRDFAAAPLGSDERAIGIPGQRRVLDLPYLETASGTRR